MSGDAESYSQAEIVRLLKRLDKNVDELGTDLKRLEANYVTRAEWEMRTQFVDREIRDLKAADSAAKPVKVSGWVIAGIGVSALAALISVAGFVILLIQNIK